MEQLAGFERLVADAFVLLFNLEFSFDTRYGAACPVCGGAKEEDYGYVERGPDRGHEPGCKLRSVLDRVEEHAKFIEEHPKDFEDIEEEVPGAKT